VVEDLTADLVDADAEVITIDKTYYVWCLQQGS
jgi:hypothetical protein